MNINARTVSCVKFSTERDWLRELPQANWLCVLLVDGAPRRYLDEVLPKLLLRNVAGCVASVSKANGCMT